MTLLPDPPTTLPDFQRMFATDEACAAYLFQIRYPDGYACPQCGSKKAWKVDDLQQMICDAGHRVTATAGTIMHRTKMPLTVWFMAAYLVSTLKPGISAMQFQAQLGLTRYETAFQLLHKLRSALVDPDRESLRGEVEVDEAFVGGREEGRPGRGAVDKALVVLAVEVIRWIAPDPMMPDDPNAGIEKTRAGRIRMSVIPDATAETLIPWVQQNVEVGSLVLTDGHGGYNALEKLGYAHKRVLQSHQGKKTGLYLPMVHLIISNLKRWILGTHKGAILNYHLPAYLNEFVFRFNRRFWRGPAFIRILTLSTEAEDRPEYETLYGVKKKEADAWVHPNPRSGVGERAVDATYEAAAEGAEQPLGYVDGPVQTRSQGDAP